MLHLYQPKLVLDLYFALNSFHEVLLTSEKSHSLISKTILDCAFWDPENFEMTRKIMHVLLCKVFYTSDVTKSFNAFADKIKRNAMEWITY